MKVGDRLPAVEAELAINESGVNGGMVQEVKFVWRRQGHETLMEGTADKLQENPLKVRYEWKVNEPGGVGEYQGEWKVKFNDDRVMTFRNGPEGDQFIRFAVLRGVAVEANVTPIDSLYDMIRHLAGDLFPPFMYKDIALRTAVQTMISINKLKGYSLTADRTAITPKIENGDHLGRLLYHTVKSFVDPEFDAYSYRMRSMSESFGGRRTFIRELKEILHKMENGSMFGGSKQNLGTWLVTVCGMDVYSAGLVEMPKLSIPATTTVFSSCCHCCMRDGLWN
ncbi:MAG TPA: hypothetical protein VGH19_06695 [Verrucomicrobiae bacterium]